MRLIRFCFQFIFLFCISFLVAFVFYLFASRNLSPRIIEHPLSMLAVGVLVAVIFGKLIGRGITRTLNLIGVREEPLGFKRLRDLTHELLFEKDLLAASNLLVNSFSEELKLNTAAIFLLHEGSFEPAAFFGYPPAHFKGFRLRIKQSQLLKILEQKKGSLKGLGPKEPLSRSPESLEGELHRIKSAYLFPFFRGSEFFGFLSIGFKKQGSPSQEEVRFIKTLIPILSAVFYKDLTINLLKKTVENFPKLQSGMLQSMKLSALEQLATGIAHEIHNPLTIISGKAQVLLLKKSKTFDAKQVEEVLNTIVHQTKRASDVTRKLLMFTRSSGRSREEINLEAVLKDTLSLISYQMSLDQVKLEREISPSLPAYWGNMTEVREIFMNLILNAIQATPEKGKVRIVLRTSSSQDKIEFCVEDSGKGIPKAEMEKIFDPFFSSTHEKLGLGLYITERLVFKNGGRIHAESEEGKGSLFLVELPLQASGEEIRENLLSGTK